MSSAGSRQIVIQDVWKVLSFLNDEKMIHKAIKVAQHSAKSNSQISRKQLLLSRLKTVFALRFISNFVFQWFVNSRRVKGVQHSNASSLLHKKPLDAKWMPLPNASDRFLKQM